jgi:hypothetical protein
MKGLSFGVLACVIAGWGAGCCKSTPAQPTLSVFFASPDGGILPDGSTLPYHSGGPFTVGVSAGLSGLQQSTHAFIEIVEPSSPTGAIMSATATLTEQDGGAFSGSAPLAWPLGGPVPVRVHAMGQIAESLVPLEVPDLVVDYGARTNTGSQELVPVCITSSAADGNVSIHLDQAVVAGGTQSDLMASLVLGDCPNIASSLTSPKSHASFTAVSMSSASRVTVSLVGTNVVRARALPASTFVPVVLYVTAPHGTAPAPGSIVEVKVHATFAQADGGVADGGVADGGVADGGISGAPGITISLQGAPSVAIVPASVTTDDDGDASAHFQMPSSGAVHIEAIVGSSRSGIDFQ